MHQCPQEKECCSRSSVRISKIPLLPRELWRHSVWCIKTSLAAPWGFRVGGGWGESKVTTRRAQSTIQVSGRRRPLPCSSKLRCSGEEQTLKAGGYDSGGGGTVFCFEEKRLWRTSTLRGKACTCFVEALCTIVTRAFSLGWTWDEHLLGSLIILLVAVLTRF